MCQSQSSTMFSKVRKKVKCVFKANGDEKSSEPAEEERGAASSSRSTCTGVNGSTSAKLDQDISVRRAQCQLPEGYQSQYSCIRYLNRGASGFVVLVERKDTGEKRALKFIERESARMEYIEAEIINQMRLRHPHVVKLDEIFVTDVHLVLVLEYADQGDLFSYLKNKSSFSERRARWYFQQLITAVDFCHKMGVMNRDIKLENLLLFGENKETLKISDFGLSKDEHYQSAPKTSVGTVLYIAPEIISHFGEKKEYDARKSDLWSCGVVLYTMLSGFYPFSRKSDKDIGRVRLMHTILQRTLDKDYPDIEGVSESCKTLLAGLLDPNPNTRYSMEDVMNHPWFKTGKNLDKYNQEIVDYLKKRPKVTDKTVGMVKKILDGEVQRLSPSGASQVTTADALELTISNLSGILNTSVVSNG